jgi:hypothetical protein
MIPNPTAGQGFDIVAPPPPNPTAGQGFEIVSREAAEV